MKLAIVQDGPIFNNLQATLDKTFDYISQAVKQSADLIVFGETWMSGYPIWLDVYPSASLWDYDPVKEVWASTFRNGLGLHSSEMQKLSEFIKESKIWVIMGANEPILTGIGNGTIYNSIYTFNEEGVLVNHHRKLMPTFSEKLVYGLGDGKGLKSVKTPYGQVGSLICWEHWMPLTRQAMHDDGEDLHMALWPMVKDMNQVASRQYAFEGRCHVVSVGQIMEAREFPKELALPESINKDSFILKGGSSVFGPDGSIILEPQYERRDLIVIDLNLESNLKEKMNLSVSGHYNRRDIFQFQVKRERE